MGGEGLVDRVVGVLLALMLLATAVAPASLAQANVELILTPETYSFNATVTAPVYNGTVSLAGNNTPTAVAIILPDNWTQDHVKAVHVYIETSQELQLAAYAGTTTVATATVVPLGTAYYQALPGTVDKIELSSATATNVTVYILVEADAQFKVALADNVIRLAPGASSNVNFTVTQVAGPPVYVWFRENVASPLVATVYMTTGQAWNDPLTAPRTTGAGWTGNGYISLEWPATATPQNDNINVEILMFASPIKPTSSTPVHAELVASVSLAGIIAGDVASLYQEPEDIYLSLGVGAIFAIILIAVIVILRGGGGRRGMAQMDGRFAIGIAFLLLIIAAVGLSAGLFDVEAKYDVDPALAGVGFLALFALAYFIARGYIPAPRSVKRFLP